MSQKPVPEGWQEVGFKDFFEILNAKKYQVLKSDYLTSGAIPILDQGQEFIVGYTNEEDKRLDPGNGVIVFGDHTRIIKYADFPFAVGADGTQILTSKETVIPRFAYYQLANKKISNLGYSRHFKLIKEMMFWKPPLCEQEKITSILYSVDQAIDTTRQVINQTRQVKRALMQELLTRGLPGQHTRFKPDGTPEDWNTLPLLNLCKRITDGTHQGVKTVDKGIPFIYVSCVRDGKINWESSSRITESDYLTISKGREPKPGVIVYTVKGSYGRVALVTDERPFSFQRDIAYILPDEEKIMPAYLALYLDSPMILTHADSVAVGQAQKAITLKELGKYPIKVPPMDEQQNIVMILTSLEGRLDIEIDKLKALETVKISLMQALLTGEKRVGLADQQDELLEVAV